MQIELRDIGKITPYEKNPRLNDDAVDAVAASIEGAVLPGTQEVVAPKRERIKLSDLRHSRR